MGKIYTRRSRTYLVIVTLWKTKCFFLYLALTPSFERAKHRKFRSSVILCFLTPQKRFLLISTLANFLIKAAILLSLARSHNRPRSIYQYSNMAPRLSGQNSIFGVVFFVSESLLGIEGQKKLEKFAILTRKPRSRARILIYRTWPIEDGDRKILDARASMIWDNFSILRTICAILTSYIRADPRTGRGRSLGCCHVS